MMNNDIQGISEKEILANNEVLSKTIQEEETVFKELRQSIKNATEFYNTNNKTLLIDLDILLKSSMDSILELHRKNILVFEKNVANYRKMVDEISSSFKEIS